MVQQTMRELPLSCPAAACSTLSQNNLTNSIPADLGDLSELTRLYENPARTLPAAPRTPHTLPLPRQLSLSPHGRCITTRVLLGH